ncbi:hypothetical protein AAVH_33018, partial [Aphelenchoides avenae]
FVLALALTVCAAYAQVPNGPSDGPVPPRRPPPPPPQQQCRRPGEVFVPCSYPDGTCSQPVPLYCPLSCGRPACRCRPGWVRNAQNTCVPVARCPQHDLDDDVFTFDNASHRYHNDCERPFDASNRCANALYAFDRGGDHHSADGLHAIHECGDSHPADGIADCAQGEMFTLCSTTEATCANLVPAWPRQQPRYGPPKCQCLPGYVRQNGTCVPIATCFAGVTTPSTVSTPTTSGNITLPTPRVPVPGPFGK